MGQSGACTGASATLWFGQHQETGDPPWIQNALGPALNPGHSAADYVTSGAPDL